MDFVKELFYKTNLTLWIAAFVAFAVFVLFKKRRLNLPPGPRGLPIVGYLPFLTKEPHLKLHELSKKYGDIFGLYMGSAYVVVVSDSVVARELFNKAEVSDRPPDIFHIMPGGVGLGELNGPEWVEQRRYTLQKMKNLGFGKSEWEGLVQEDLCTLVDILHQTGGQPYDINKALSASISNNTLSLVSGQRLPLDNPRRNIVDRGVAAFLKLFDQSGLISLYPKLYEKALSMGLVKGKEELKDLKEMHEYIRSLVKEFKSSDDSHTYIQEYLKEIENNKKSNLKNSFSERNLIGNTQALIIAGSDTTKVSLLWVILAMASYPDVQDKVHQELDSILGKDENPAGWMDRFKLPYCYAVLMEAQRWRTVAPMNVLHNTSSDVTVRGYVIPKNSNIIGFLWAFHNDDRYWTNPDEFQPERFLSQDGKVVTKIDHFAPFSFGKRLCIGETVALVQLFIYFVGIMKRFRILPASENEPPNLKGTLGLALKPLPQNLRYVPR